MAKSRFDYTAPRFRTKEAAGYIGISDESLTRSRLTGKLMGTKSPRFLKVGTAKNSPVVYPRAELDRWVAQFKLQDFSDVG